MECQGNQVSWALRYVLLCVHLMYLLGSIFLPSGFLAQCHSWGRLGSTFLPDMEKEPKEEEKQRHNPSLCHAGSAHEKSANSTC